MSLKLKTFICPPLNRYLLGGWFLKKQFRFLDLFFAGIVETRIIFSFLIRYSFKPIFTHYFIIKMYFWYVLQGVCITDLENLSLVTVVTIKALANFLWMPQMPPKNLNTTKGAKNITILKCFTIPDSFVISDAL